MKYRSQCLLITATFLLSLSSHASSELSSQDESFISYAAEGNRAQLQKIDVREIASEVRFMALIESVRTGKKQTTAWLLSSASFQEMELQLVLRMAASQGHEKIVELLLAHGAPLNGFTSGETALMVAAREGKDAVVKLLLAKGANTALVSQNSARTAYQLAQLHERTSILKIKGLRPIAVQAPASKFTAINAILVSVVGLVTGYIYVRGIMAVQGNAVPGPRQYHGQGLALRLARDPRSTAAAGRPVVAAGPGRAVDQMLGEISSMINRLPDGLRSLTHMAVSEAMKSAEPIRAQMVAMIHHRTTFLLRVEISRILAEAERKGKELLSQAIAVAVSKLLQSRLPSAAPAA